CILAYSYASLASRDFCQISWFSRSTAPSCFCRPFTVKTPQKSGQDVGMSDRARALRHSPLGQGFTPTPRIRA
ncbi:hypothetical protein ACM3AQ_005499, partial [Escherichia coli]